MSELVKALAAVQAKLPTVAKGQKADVETKTGRNYSYKYADLAAISSTVLPLLGEHGLAWTTRPTFSGERFVLAYELRHVSGEEIAGEYPLPERGSPQEIGSAITYARRYTLCSVTGVAPETDDDDGHAAQRSHQRDEWEVAAPPPTEEQAQVFDELLAAVKEAGSEEDIAAVGGRVKQAHAEQLLTPMQYERLARAAATKLAELKGGAA